MLIYYDFPSEHGVKIHTNNIIEHLNRDIQRRTRLIGTFPDGNSTRMLVCVRLLDVASTLWGNKKYMSMKRLEAICDHATIAGWAV